MSNKDRNVLKGEDLTAVNIQYELGMKLQSTIPITPAQHPIGYDSRVMLLGSCFAEHIGAKLHYFQFQNCINPMGIYFHPRAIEGFLQRIRKRHFFTSEDVFQQGEQWNCFEAHSRLSKLSEKALVKELNDKLEESEIFLRSCTHLFLTLGTAWGYKHKASDQWVANCHKVPQKAFDKCLWEVEALEDCLLSICDMIRELNPRAQLVCSISPVRHLKDGFQENQRSKAHLITAVHRLVDTGHVAYFPSYELLMDELRDYRFYKADLVHPNNLAIDYIWEKFRSAWIREESYPVMEEVAAVRKGLAHRPFNPESEAHQRFVQSLQQRISLLQSKYAHINLLS